MGLLERISAARNTEDRDSGDGPATPISISDWAKMFRPGGVVNYSGRNYQAFQLAASAKTNSLSYESNPIVFACEAKRIGVFSEARLTFQRLEGGRPGGLFGTPELDVLNEPWPGASLRDLLCIAEFDIATCGNSYWVRDVQGYLQRLDPAHVTIVTEALYDETTGYRTGERLLGYAYTNAQREITRYDPESIAHYKPIPGPSQFVGQSWMTACFTDVDADAAMTRHKQVTVRNGANLRTVVSLKETVSSEEFKKFVELFRSEHEGPENSGRTLFLGGGADVNTVSQTFSDLAYKATVGAGETRIASCAGVHPVVVGLSEGMQGSSLNAGNYGAAKRNFVDGTMRPLWGAFAYAFRWLVKVPTGCRLWYDDRDIAFLRDDLRDQADVLKMDASTIRQLTDAGFKPDAVIAAVDARDLSLLKGNHSGLFSVQLQPPGTVASPVAQPNNVPTTIGSGNGKKP